MSIENILKVIKKFEKTGYVKYNDEILRINNNSIEKWDNEINDWGITNYTLLELNPNLLQKTKEPNDNSLLLDDLPNGFKYFTPTLDNDKFVKKCILNDKNIDTIYHYKNFAIFENKKNAKDIGKYFKAYCKMKYISNQLGLFTPNWLNIEEKKYTFDIIKIISTETYLDENDNEQTREITDYDFKIIEIDKPCFKEIFESKKKIGQIITLLGKDIFILFGLKKQKNNYNWEKENICNLKINGLKENITPEEKTELINILATNGIITDLSILPFICIKNKKYKKCIDLQHLIKNYCESEVY